MEKKQITKVFFLISLLTTCVFAIFGPYQNTLIAIGLSIYLLFRLHEVTIEFNPMPSAKAAIDKAYTEGLKKALSLWIEHSDDQFAAQLSQLIKEHETRPIVEKLIDSEIKPAPRPGWRHIKRGTTYDISHDYELQTSRPLKEGDVIRGYICRETGKPWCRPIDEFVDGRFEPLSPQISTKD